MLPKLNFRAKPLLLPAVRRDVENQLPKPPKPPKPKQMPKLSQMPKMPKMPNLSQLSNLSNLSQLSNLSKLPPIQPHWLAFPAIFVLIVCLRVWLHVAEVHTIHSLTCTRSKREVRCLGKASGTFVVDVPSDCDSVYEIDGVPFSAAMHDGVFRVPAKHMTIKDVFGECNVQAYLDSTPTKISMPFTWITTAQHKRFTIYVDNQMVVESAVASLFPSVKRGVWIAYTFDFTEDIAAIRVSGDGTDVIYTYAAR